MQLLSQAKTWWDEMVTDKLCVSEVARRHNVDKSYVSRVVRLNHLAPKVRDLLLRGDHPVGLDATRLVSLRNIPLAWDKQERLLLGHGFATCKPQRTTG
jgi:hypothetical protein